MDPSSGRRIFCPECITTPRLSVLKVENVEIDRCPECHGVWLDAGEFQAILDLKVKTPGPTLADGIGEGLGTAADPLLAEALLHVIAQAGEFSKEAAGVIVENIGEVLGGLFSGF
jgi:hypothetical protein